jgi:hypothetical protein
MSGGGGGAGNSGQIPQGEPFQYYDRRTIITAVSTAGSNLAADNSSFDVALGPINLPDDAINISATLVNAAFQNTYIPTQDMPNPIFIEANFLTGDGVNPQGQASQILAMIPHRNTYYITYDQGFQLSVPCNLADLQSPDGGTTPPTATFTLKDGDGNLVNGGGVWSVQVRIEWQQQQSYQEAKDNRHIY